MILTTKDVGTDEYISRLSELTSIRPMRYRVITFGCQQNEADSERISAMLEAAGLLPSESSGDESVVIVNTCAIRAHAEAKALSLLGNYKAKKRSDPSFVLGVVGCMGAKPDTVGMLKRDFHYVSFTASPSALHEIPKLVYTSLSEGIRSFPPDVGFTDVVEGIAPKRTNRHKAWVSIMYGCNNFCSYCIVPYVRGRERSRQSADVISECKSLVSDGVKEITLLGQNVNSYSSDMNFASLLSHIAELPGDFIIRFMTSHPKDTSDELIKVMASYPEKIAPFFHLPLQSGSNKILKAMNRTYSAEKYLEVVRKLRDWIPDIALSTDVIVGFPGEEEADFQDTLSVLTEVGYDNVYAFLYSPREGTRAASFEDQVPREVKDARMARLIPTVERISKEKNLSYVGKTLRVLTDSSEQRPDGGYLLCGRTAAMKLVHFTSERSAVGEFVTVHIDEARPYGLIGTEVGK